MSLEAAMKFYESCKQDLETRYHLQWIIIRGSKVIGTFDDFQKAGAAYEKEFDGTPMLLRQVGYEPDLDRARINFAVI